MSEQLLSNDYPDDWNVTTIGDLSERVGSGVTPTGGSEVYTNSGVIFLRSQNVTNEGLKLNDVAYIDFDTHTKMSASSVVDFDVLINITGASIGRVTYVPKGFSIANVNQHVCEIRLKSPLEDSAKFYSYILQSDIGQSQIHCLNAGGNREGLNFQQLRSFVVPEPPKVQIDKIAKILSTVDNLIEKTQTLIDKYTAIKQGMMADLFTRGIDMTTSDTPNSKSGKLRPSVEDAPELYKQTELGWVPKEWEVLSFGELADYKNGNSFSADSWKDEGYPIIRIQNLNGSNEYNYYEGVVKSIWHILPGDLLFAWSGQKGVSFGARVWNGPEGVLNQHIFKVYENAKILSRQFLYYLFKLNVGRIEDNAHGFKDSFVHVTRSELTDVRVKVPPKEEQLVIEARVKSLDRKLDGEVESLGKYKKLKKGLMQDLLTGKVKVG